MDTHHKQVSSFDPDIHEAIAGEESRQRDGAFSIVGS